MSTFRQTEILALLTKRQLEVLTLIADGHTAKMIAHMLNISQHTVRGHVKDIRSRLQCRNMTQAVAWLERSRGEGV